MVLWLDLIKGSDKARPDLVFITDGQAPPLSFQKEWEETKRRLTVKCFGVFVGSYGGSDQSVLREIADDVRTVADLTDVQQVRDIMRQS